MFNLYHVPNSISELNGYNTMMGKNISVLKNKFKILIIDDETLVFKDRLTDMGFRISVRNDIDAITDVEAFDIILCDIRGVGKFLGDEFEGAFLAKCIQDEYPNKIVRIYTSSKYDSKFQKYIDQVGLIEKGQDLAKWVEILQNLMIEYSDPIQQWKKTRSALLNQDVPTIMVAKYESAFVNAIKNGKNTSIQNICNTEKNINVTKILMATIDIAKTAVEIANLIK